MCHHSQGGVGDYGWSWHTAADGSIGGTAAVGGARSLSHVRTAREVAAHAHQALRAAAVPDRTTDQEDPHREVRFRNWTAMCRTDERDGYECSILPFKKGPKAKIDTECYNTCV